MYWKGAVMRSIIEFTRLNEFAVIFIAFVLAYALVDLVVEPIQHQFVSSSTMAGSLLFIPHGIRVLSVWLCGVRAILPLIAAEFLGAIFLWQPDVGLDVLLGSSMVGGLCVYLTFEVFRLAGIEMRPDGKDSALTQLEVTHPVGRYCIESLTLLESKSSLEVLRHLLMRF